MKRNTIANLLLLSLFLVHTAQAGITYETNKPYIRPQSASHEKNHEKLIVGALCIGLGATVLLIKYRYCLTKNLAKSTPQRSSNKQPSYNSDSRSDAGTNVSSSHNYTNKLTQKDIHNIDQQIQQNRAKKADPQERIKEYKQQYEYYTRGIQGFEDKMKDMNDESAKKSMQSFIDLYKHLRNNTIEEAQNTLDIDITQP
jgi:hypothetical protein